MKHTFRRSPVALLAAVVFAVVGSVALMSHHRASHAPAEVLSSPVAGFFGSRLIPRDGGSFGLQHMQTRRTDDMPFSRYLRVSYPALSSSPLAASADAEITAGGAQLYLVNSSGPLDHAYLRYYLRLPKDFSWIKGGKLPGLYGGSVTSGRKIPNGSDGFSTRYMWRAGGAGEVYAYLPTSVEHGTSLGRGSWSWPTGRWSCVEQEVRLNRPGTSDGSVRVWLDGARVLDQTGLTFRTDTSLKIQGLFFSTFFGGGDRTWANTTPQHADFADFGISEEPLACDS